MSQGEPISRRQALARMTAAAAANTTAAAVLHGQQRKDVDTSADLNAKLIHVFPNAYLLAAGSTGNRLCLYSTLRPDDLLVQKGRKWTTRSSDDRRDDALEVIELPSYRTLYRESMRAKVDHASFFAGDDQLYAETQPYLSSGQRVSQQVVVDLPSGNQEEKVRAENVAGTGVFYTALDPRILFSAEFSRKTMRYTMLRRSTWPNLNQTTSAPFAVTSEQDPIGHDSDLFFSADHRALVYCTDRWIVCRRSNDLGVLWKRSIEPDFFGATRLAMSENARWVAAAVVDTTFIEQQRRYYVAVYSGADGSLVSKLSVKGDAGLAISPDGRRLAIAERTDPVPLSEDIELAVSIYDIETKRRITRVVHDRFESRKREWVNSHFGIQGIQFTRGGEVLITSGIQTKVWELTRA